LRRVSCYIDGRGNRLHPSLSLSHLTNNFPLDLLQYNSGLIGYYALLSASMGEFNIDVFEPSLMNNIRTCESIRLNKWQNEWQQQASAVPRKIGSPVVNVWNAGVSDTTGKFKFFESYGNPGAARFGGFGNNRTDYVELPVTTLDTFAEERSWFQSQPEIAILQIDVEQDNYKVLAGAQKLLKSGIVQNVFTKVSRKDPSMISKEMAAHELLVEAGYKLKGQGGWAGPSKDSLWPDDANLVKNIFQYLEEEHKESLTLWWGL
jgi:FkbM family methyltransferase